MLAGLSLTECSDIHSLGVLLFQRVVGDFRRALVLGIGALLVVGLLDWKPSRALADARRHGSLATLVNDFLQRDLLSGAAPNATGKPDPTVLDMQKRAQSKVFARFAG